MTEASWPPRPAELPGDTDYVELFEGTLRCWQPRRGYRFSVDSVLLAMRAFDLPGEEVLELGTGSGVVLLVLARQRRFRRLVGLEVQRDLAACARCNLSDAPGAERLTVVEGDLRDPPPAVAQARFDIVVANPPYYPVGDGHVNPDRQRAVARHEVVCTMVDVLDRAHAALRDDGRAVLTYPASRHDELSATAPDAGLAVEEVQLVRSRTGYEPRQALFVLRRRTHGEPAGAPALAPPLDLHDPQGRPTGALADFIRRLTHLADS